MNPKKHGEPAIVEVGFMPNCWAGGSRTQITDSQSRSCQPTQSMKAEIGNSVSQDRDAV